VEVDRNGLEVLSRDECLRLLGTAALGRVAVTTAALPTILPVNFRFDGRHILIRTGRGTKLDAATRNAVVAFEVDEVEPATREGWSVVVTGVARVDRAGGAGRGAAAAARPLGLRRGPSRGSHLDRGGFGPSPRAGAERTMMVAALPAWVHTERRGP
jgi:hypothetical protein